MAAGSKRLLRAVEKRMFPQAPPADLREASSEQLAQILGVEAERFHAMTDAELEAIIKEG